MASFSVLRSWITLMHFFSLHIPWIGSTYFHVCKSNLNHRENLIYVCRSLTVLFKYNYYTATLTDTSILARLAKKHIRQFLLGPVCLANIIKIKIETWKVIRSNKKMHPMTCKKQLKIEIKFDWSKQLWIWKGISFLQMFVFFFSSGIVNFAIF